MREIRDPDVLANIQVPDNMSMIDVIRRMNETSMQILVVIDSEKSVVGVITDGDVRRALIRGLDFSARAREICNTSPKTVVEFDKNEAGSIMRTYQVTRVPVTDEGNHLIGMIKLEESSRSEEDPLEEYNVVIMAGGKGSRLKPITEIIPKALVPVNGKAMIEIIMDSFSSQGLANFILSVNYKKEFIKAYFTSRKDYSNRITYIEEERFQGTAGSLNLLRGKISKPFFLTNCDILVKADYSKAMNFHRRMNHVLTIIGGLQRISVPYGVIKMKDGLFDSIEEKPSLHYVVNTGVYIIEPSVLEEINENEKLDMPDLIERLKTSGKNIGVYPTHEDWVDIGTWAELKKTF
ncbi:Nucleotidyl transferase [Mesotoga infera]|nr:Nucleotidyl transferase [Mesotoga infera]